MVTQNILPIHSGYSAVLACILVRKVPSDLAKIIMNSLKSQLFLMQNKQSNLTISMSILQESCRKEI